ncbi:type I phosphomannose isomerase catalytic subunit [Saccharicrinis sp. FJH62]|uniref:type I phosphomannose isomerase catalytic subunit n=1 Tax=Saccharicrinis sp. FJH62 TaxID=3344657 RepID=UPI0035D3DCB2
MSEKLANKKLYPLKFDPILKERIWGGNKLKSMLGKNPDKLESIGESWELSAVKENVSLVANGELKGNSLTDLIKLFKHQLVGKKVYNKFKEDFPLLIKLIDAKDDLSVQVHPDDVLATKKHDSFGKTEMWYVLDDSKKPKLVNGFKKHTSREEVLSMLRENTFTELLNIDSVKKGDVAFIPAGRIHAICKGNLVVEIQQTSDITYRVYDYDRVDKNGKKRELHVEDGLDALDYSAVGDSIIPTRGKNNKVEKIVKCQYFTCNLIQFDSLISREYMALDCFKILIGVDGVTALNVEDNEEIIRTGDVVLIPAIKNNIKLVTDLKPAKLLEIFID